MTSKKELVDLNSAAAETETKMPKHVIHFAALEDFSLRSRASMYQTLEALIKCEAGEADPEDQARLNVLSRVMTMRIDSRPQAS